VHQSFPGQYIHIVRPLAAQGGHQLVALGLSALQQPIPACVHYRRYSLQRGNGVDVHHLAGGSTLEDLYAL